MPYRVQISPAVLAFLEELDDKSRRICKTHLMRLATGPYPGRGPGNKERLVVRGQEVYRMHISRRYTAFYIIIEPDTVRVLDLLGIDQAHKKYGYK